jgi:ankyrin repeat protein
MRQTGQIVRSGMAMPVCAMIHLLAACGQSGGISMGASTASDKVPQEVVRIIDAIDNGDMQSLKSMLDSGVNPTPPSSPLSPIHAAITHFDKGQLLCNQDALKLLLEHGADPNFIDHDSGFSPLEDALQMGEMVCVELLRNAGARIDKQGLSGDPILEFAVRGAIRTNDMGILRHVLSWNVDVNERSGVRKQTVLFTAAATPGGEFAFKELLKHGADPCIQDSSGMLPSERAQSLARNLKGVAKSHSQEFLDDIAILSDRCKPGTSR